jgi:hypothetical protein
MKKAAIQKDEKFQELLSEFILKANDSMDEYAKINGILLDLQENIVINI